MGTNFYLMSKNREFIRDNFAVRTDWGVVDKEYDITDDPYLGYEIHLNKLSYGWRPLFQRHKAFKTFKELDCFFHQNASELEIYDEYGKKFLWQEYFERVYGHSMRKKEYCKWVYEKDLFFKDEKPTLHTVLCTEDEAEICIPFNHILYFQTENAARKKFGVYQRYSFEMRYWNDPDYQFDWTEGDFS